MKATRIVLAALIAMAAAPAANAVPAFARQTGQHCNACHFSFPELTPYGRWFKLTGYTIGQRTIPLAMMAELSRTETRKNVDPATGFQVTPENDHVVLQDISLFVAGKVNDNVGGFIQYTYDHQANNQQNPANGQWSHGGHASLDNTDIRAVGQYIAPGSQVTDLVYGVTLHNNPSVQDVWNTTPAWSFPFTGSATTQFGAPGTIIEGGAAPVAGLGAYVFWKKTLYAEISFYRTADKFLSALRQGTPNADRVALKGYNPYWRLAYNQEWGSNSVEVGTFGMIARVFPDNTMPTGPSDRFRDLGVDAQYQYITERHSFSTQASYIHEKQAWNASFAAAGTDNLTDSLNSFKAKASYYFQRKYGASIGYFQVTGSQDATFWTAQAGVSGNPDTRGYVYELNWLVTENARLMLQYTDYRKFFGRSVNYDGAGRNASDNNTLFLNLWISY